MKAAELKAMANSLQTAVKYNVRTKGADEAFQIYKKKPYKKVADSMERGYDRSVPTAPSMGAERMSAKAGYALLNYMKAIEEFENAAKEYMEHFNLV